MTSINQTTYTNNMDDLSSLMETANINQTVNNMDDLSSLMETTNIKKQEEIDLLMQRYNFLCQCGNYISIDDLLETNLYYINEICWDDDIMYIKDMLENTLQCTRDNVKNYSKHAYKNILIYLGYNVN